MRDDLIQRLRDEADLCRAETADDIARLLDEAAVALTQARLEADRYRWMRASWLDGADTGEDSQMQRAIDAVYTEEEMDAAIDAELKKPENASLRAGAPCQGQPKGTVPTAEEWTARQGVVWSDERMAGWDACAAQPQPKGTVVARGHHPDARVDVAAQALAAKHWHWDKLPDEDRDSFRSRAREILVALDALAPNVQSTPAPTGWVTMWPAVGGGDKPVYSHGANRPSYGAELNELLTVYPVYAQAPAPGDGDARDAARWRTFIGLDYAIRAEWAANLSLAPVLTQWVDNAGKERP